MLVAQELHYTTTGSYRVRRNLVTIYKIEPNGATNLIHVALTSEGERIPDFGVPMGRLPDMEVSATRFKDFEKKRNVNR